MKRRALSAVAVAASAGVLAWTLSRDWQTLRALRLHEPALIALLPCLVTTHIFFTGRLADVVLTRLGLHLRIGETFGLAVLSRVGNHLAPRGGAVVRALYLQRRYGCALVDFVSATAAASATNLLLTLVLASLALTAIPGKELQLPALRAAVPTLAAGMLIAALLAPRFGTITTHRCPKLARLLAGWRLVWSDWRVLLRSMGFGLLQIAAGTMLTLLEFRLIGAAVPTTAALFLTTAGSLHYLVKLTPAGIGIHESVVVLAGLAVGISPAAALCTVLLRRCAIVSVLLALGPVFAARLLLSWQDLRITRKPLTEVDGP